MEIKNIRSHDELFKTARKASDQRENDPQTEKCLRGNQESILEVCLEGGPGARIP